MKMPTAFSKETLSKIGSNAKASASKLYSSTTGLFKEESMLAKAKETSLHQVTSKEKDNLQGFVNAARNIGNPGAVSKAHDTLMQMIQQSPHAAEIKQYLEGKIKQLTPEAQKELAAAYAAVNNNGGVRAATQTAKQQFEGGQKSVSKSIRNKTPGNVAGQYYVKPFTEGASKIANGKKAEGFKRMGAGVARVGGTVGAVGGSAYAVHALTSDYREDYKKNTGSRDF